jgi:hypothetical protein
MMVRREIARSAAFSHRSEAQREFWEVGNTGGAFPFTKTYGKRERPHEVRLVIVRAPRIYVGRPAYPMMMLESSEVISQALAQNTREDGGARQLVACCVAPDTMPDAVFH